MKRLSNNVLGEMQLVYLPDSEDDMHSKLVANCYPNAGQSVLSYANFEIFNATYGDAEHDTCYTCSGTGGFVTGEMQGDEHMTGWVETFDSCSDCIGATLCPGCMQPLSLSFDLSAFEATTTWVAYDNPYYATNLGYLKRTFDYEDALSAMPFEDFICLCCGWQYDPDRHYENDYEPDYDDGDYDYPALDASEFFLI